MTYTEKDVLKIAKRFKNKKRSYLIVNPLQAKHIPVSPREALKMMEALGSLIAQQYPKANLVIGFAETATAIGAAAANALGNDCVYIHTTREDFTDDNTWLEFKEEHSHAIGQKLCKTNFNEYLKNTSEIILIDDELSTGKTLINIVERLRKEFPQSSLKKIIAASIINRLTSENTQRLQSLGIECLYLVKSPDVDYTDLINDISINAPTDLLNSSDVDNDFETINIENKLLNPRIGVNVKDYAKKCIFDADYIITKLSNKCRITDNVLILGTEEFMYPALILAERLQNSNAVNTVKCHSTTRSPIGINSENQYPIKEGYKLPSFYDSNRETYIYNLKTYNKVIVISDTKSNDMSAMRKLSVAFKKYGTPQLFYVKGGSDV